MSPLPDTRTIAGQPALLPEYEAWLERLGMTYESVAYCCFYRLDGDRGLAEHVSMQVIAGLLARPKVFQHFGLPFSGRVAHLAEVGIAEARGDTGPAGGRWEELRAALAQLTPEDQEVVVLTCVDGGDDAELAEALGCDEPAATARREATLRRLRDVSDRISAAPARKRNKGD